MNFEIKSANPVVKTLIEGKAPRPARLAAAKGILPLPQEDILEVQVALAASDDAEIAESARESLRGYEHGTLKLLLESKTAPHSVLNYFAARPSMPPEIHEAIILNPETPTFTLTNFARNTQNGAMLELISMNQQLMIRAPEIIEAIIANPNRTPEAERRAAETRREFFEKERGQKQIAEELRAQGNEAAAEFFERAETPLDPEDAVLIAAMIEVPDVETDDSWLGLEYLEELYEETDEQRQKILNKILGEFQFEEGSVAAERISMIQRIMKMGMKDRMKIAMKGDREARGILIRDPNRIVAMAVISNPKITDQEVEKMAAMRSIPEDVLRHIANNRQWQRSYAIIHNLAKNPRTPIGNVMSILTRLQMRDLVALTKNRNVSDAVRRQALRLSAARKGQ